MSDTVYDLSTVSSGVSYLTDGYVEYAESVITDRALPSIYDGLKPVNRRIIEEMRKKDITKNFAKSAKVVGDTMGELHPHGDTSIYSAMVLMTNENGSLAFPLIAGSGNFGGVHTDDPPAAYRYTEVKLHPNAQELFGEMNGIDMIPNFDATTTEPEYFPVSFPMVLVNSTSGIAVGFRSNIPSFNFNDVCDLVTEFIENGECSTVIAPDFVTGGYYVSNKKELQKLMTVGVGRLKLRSRSFVDGKKIVVTEIPYGKTFQKLIKQINDIDSNLIKNAYDTDDYDHGASFTIECSNKNRVDDAYYTVLKNSDLQYTYSADITVVQDGVPRQMGVWGIIAEWVQWRRGVLLREYQHRYAVLKDSLREAEAFMHVVNDEEKRVELARIVAKSGKAAGAEYIRNSFTREDVPEDLIDFCASRSLPTYHTGGKYANIIVQGKFELESLQKDIDNIDEVIKAQMQALKTKYGETMKRRTEVTTKDFEFIEDEKKSSEKYVDNSVCVYEVKKGFVKKLSYPSEDDTIEYRINGVANDTLIAFDNRGRLIRIYCADLPLNGVGDIGTYIPSYCGFSEEDDYKVTWAGRMHGQTLMLLYKDGNVGFVDTTEWVDNNRHVKVLAKGISVSSAPMLGAVLEDIPQMLYVTDTNGNLAWVQTSELKRKDRTAKTRAFNLRGQNMLDTYLPIDLSSGMLLVNNYEDYHQTLHVLKDMDDFRGDPEEFVYMM